MLTKKQIASLKKGHYTNSELAAMFPKSRHNQGSGSPKVNVMKPGFQARIQYIQIKGTARRKPVLHNDRKFEKSFGRETKKQEVL